MSNSAIENSKKIGLLVSVRDEQEANIARGFDIAILDVKEPNHGSLGRPSPEKLRKILAGGNRNEIVSVALGELIDLDEEKISVFFADFHTTNQHAFENLKFAKIGLSGMASIDGWERILRQCIGVYPKSVNPVAVAYLDSTNADAPTAKQITTIGSDLGCEFLLLDTYNKKAGNFLSHDSLENICLYRDMAKQNGMKLVLAGSISQSDLETIKTINPDFVGVRGAVCKSTDRGAKLSSKRLYEFTRQLYSN